MTQPDTLHTRLRDEIDRRLAVARAAEEWAPSPWKYQIVAPKRDAITSARGDWVLTFAHHYGPLTFIVDYATLHDPADAIRRYEGELEVLERHAPCQCDLAIDRPHCRTHRCPANEGHRCAEIRSLASRLGVSVDG